MVSLRRDSFNTYRLDFQRIDLEIDIGLSMGRFVILFFYTRYAVKIIAIFVPDNVVLSVRPSPLK